jgi:glycosyltransferase involved in cell wall biosynthesis
VTEAPPPGPELAQDAREALERIGQADIVVGIPSYNNADTIGHVARAVQIGLLKYFPSAKSVLVNSDGGSTDGTREVVEGATLGDLDRLFVPTSNGRPTRIITPYAGIPGKGSAFRTIFYLAARLGAKACCVVDSDLRSITPEWVESLLTPVYARGFDYVCPLYLRHKYDGTITNSIVYPLTRALYGVNLRQPIGGDFGVSGRLARAYLEKDVWDTDVARFGVDIWMTTTAVAEGYRCCQAFLGSKIHNPKDPGSELSAMLAQVVSAVFDLMATYESVWMAGRDEVSVPLFGFAHEVGLEPVRVNVQRMVEAFRLGVRELAPLYEQAVAPETWRDVRSAAEQKGESVALPDPVWAHVLYDFACADRRRVFRRDQLLRSLTPIYLGRVASFVRECEEATAPQVEERLESLCRVYRDEVPYLRERWGAARHSQEVPS